jgi:hypothetical protein
MYRQWLQSSAGPGTAAAALLLLGTLAAGPARAAPTFFVSADAAVELGQFPNILDQQSVATGQVQIPPAFAAVSLTGDPSIVSPNDSGSANSRADFGRLGAFAIATEDDGLQVTCHVTAIWRDTFIASSSDPTVTQVTFQATMSLFDSIAATNSTSGFAIASLGLSDQAHSPVGLRLEDATFTPPLVTRTVTATFTEPVGVPFSLTGILEVAAGASGTNFGLEGSITIDAGDTATFNLDVLTPGGDYTTDSGVSYVSYSGGAVPEPATFTLFGLGALVLLGYGRLCRR